MYWYYFFFTVTDNIQYSFIHEYTCVIKKSLIKKLVNKLVNKNFIVSKMIIS